MIAFRIVVVDQELAPNINILAQSIWLRGICIPETERGRERGGGSGREGEIKIFRSKADLSKFARSTNL